MIPVRRTVLAALAGAALALGLAACGEQKASGAPPTEITFSILATENSQAQQQNWGPFLADMEKETGLKIKPYFQSNYTSLIEAMRFKQVDVGWFSNLSGLEAVRRANGEVFARTTDVSGVDGYYSTILVNANSGITLDRLLRCDRSLTFGLGDAKSTSGTLAPMTYLFLPRGIDPQKCFKTVRSASHQANLFSVANGVLDAGTNNSTALDLVRQNQPELAAKVVEIWRSPVLPEDPIIWRKDLHPSAKEKLRSFLLTYGTAPGPEGDRQRRNLAVLAFGGFREADDSHLLPVREMEATRALIEARNARDAEGVRKAEAELAQIARERTAAGGGPATAAPAPVKQ